MKALVVYYSLDGNTRAAAESAAEELGCDILALEPVKPIPEKGFKKMFVGGRQATFGEKPELKKLVCDPGSYDLIILGTPVWAGKCASPVWSFIDSCAVPERIKALFTLSGGGDDSKCVRQVEKKTGTLKARAALFDARNPKSSGNGEKLARFTETVRALIRGEAAPSPKPNDPESSRPE